MTSVFSSDRSTCTGTEVHTSTSTGSRSRAPAMALITELLPRLTSPTTTTVPRRVVSAHVRRIASAASACPYLSRTFSAEDTVFAADSTSRRSAVRASACVAVMCFLT